MQQDQEEKAAHLQGHSTATSIEGSHNLAPRNSPYNGQDG